MVNHIVKFLFCFFLIVSSFSCKKTVTARCDDYAGEVSDEIDKLSTALQAYSADPSVANCEAYKDAWSDYLIELDDLFGCVPTAQRSEWSKNIDEAKTGIDNLDCR